MGAIFLLILFAALLCGSIAAMSRRNRPTRGEAAPAIGPAIETLPTIRRNDFFSATDRSLYEMLRGLTPNHTVFAKVRLADLVSVERTLEGQSHLDRIDRGHIDFVVCDKNLAPIVAIAIDDATRTHSQRGRRDQFVDEVLAAAAMPVVHVRRQRHYLMDELHRLLVPYLRIGTLIL